MKPIYLVCGVPGSGKSWACRQAAEHFNYIPHDKCWTHPTKAPSDELDPKWEKGAVSNHVETILNVAKNSKLPVLTECPFGERGVRDELEANGAVVIPIFVVEPPDLVYSRYLKREGKPPSRAMQTRATTIRNRAEEWGSFQGTSEEVLEHLSKCHRK